MTHFGARRLKQHGLRLSLVTVVAIATIGFRPAWLQAQSIAAGNTIQVKLERTVTTKSAETGDPVFARISRPLKKGTDVILPAGTRLEGRVDFVQHGEPVEDGWMRLLFNRIALPDGRTMRTLAFESFHPQAPPGFKSHLIAMAGLAAAGALLAGSGNRMAGGFGGALGGFVLVQNRRRYGRDLTLRAGKTIRLRLSQDLQ